MSTEHDERKVPAMRGLDECTDGDEVRLAFALGSLAERCARRWRVRLILADGALSRLVDAGLDVDDVSRAVRLSVADRLGDELVLDVVDDPDYDQAVLSLLWPGAGSAGGGLVA